MSGPEEFTLTLFAFDFVPEGLQKFVHDLRRQILKAFCPCHAVVRYQIPQLSTIAPLVKEARAGRYLCIPMADLSRYRAGDTDALSAVRPGAVPEDVTAFVIPELIRDPDELLASRDLQEFFELQEVITHFWRDYRIGKPLSSQPGHEAFSVPLENAFRFLWRFGLVSGDALQRRSAHSSVLMIIRRALGVRQYSDLIPYVENPPWFFASAVANSLVELSPEAPSALVGQLYKVFAQLSHEQCQPGPPRPSGALPDTTIACRLSEPDLAKVLQHLRERHAPYSASLQSLLSTVETLTSAKISPSLRAIPSLAIADAACIEKAVDDGTWDDGMDCSPERSRPAQPEGHRLFQRLERVADLGLGVTTATIVIPPLVFLAAAVLAEESPAKASTVTSLGILWTLIVAPVVAYLGWLGLTAVAHWRKLAVLDERVAGLTERLSRSVSSFEKLADAVLRKLDDIERELVKSRARH